MVSQDIWDKTQRITAELTRMDMEYIEGMYWDRMESIKGLLIYIARKYRDMNPYLKGLHLMLYIWIPYRDKYGWQLQGGELKMAKLYGKWEGIEEEVIRSNLVIGVPCLRGYLLAPGRLKKGKVTPQRKLTVQRQALAYLMGNASGVGFGYMLWGQGIMILSSGEFTLLYQGRSSNVREGNNLT